MLPDKSYSNNLPSSQQALAWQPSAGLEILERRSEFLWSIRQFFHDRGLAEVQTPILSHDTVIDRHIDPVWLPGSHLSLATADNTILYLQTSPEFCMKRLLAAGMKAIYQITPVFRAAERGAMHNPEFTMIEWYRVGDDFVQGIRFLSDLIRAALQIEQVELMTYQQAFQHLADCDPLAANLSELAAIALKFQLGVEPEWSKDRDTWLNLLFAGVVQPQLGKKCPTVITHYPASQSALSMVSAEDDRVAERYELFIDGVELANGYHELLDADELAKRNARVLAERKSDGKPPLPAQSRLLAAMRAGLPGCSGCALGFDRLLMVACGAKTIAEVIAFPIERA